jgi:transcriptional regulator with XRE-family HTH domain
MDLNKYYELAGLNDRKMSEKCGVQLETIWRIRNGKNIPRLDIAKKISEATDGAVTVLELLPEKNG